ncbi:hypothetical protein L211DRAFT_252878 [Terfezia boudieri ATCC MYA-4762]|uniref:Uncharacterized protein n=1 Tax=Terfezia boudieri ATCC MYA-4762 TaxID=1051890 RepID=A0A3N4M1G9_9PEZI|nr:hypothetical protein L211DRAFT_252878 [Terfezia boudieri ATCC MYA-4762]
MPSITSLGSWITRLGCELPQLKDSLRLPCTTVISTCAVLRNHLEGLQLTMGNIVSSVFGPLILTENTTSTEAHEVDLSRLPGAYPAIPIVCTSVTSTIRYTTGTDTAYATEHGAWAIYNRESKPLQILLPAPEVRPSYPVDWNSRIFPMLAAAAVRNTITMVFNVEENLPVARTIRVLKPSATYTNTKAPSCSLQSRKLTFKRSVWCREPVRQISLSLANCTCSS